MTTFTPDFDLEKPSEASSNAGESYNDNADRIDAGRTHKGTLGETIALGDLCYQKADGVIWKARADSIATSKVVGFITEAGDTGAERFLRCNGRITNPAWSLTIGNEVWLSPSVYGGFVHSKPASPNIAIFCGLVSDTDTIWIIGLMPTDVSGSGGGLVAHALGGAYHTADTKANLESKINDSGFNKLFSDLPAEISTLTEKTNPVGTDLVVIEDSEDSNNKKKVQVTNLSSGGLTSHAMGGVFHTADTKVNLESKINDSGFNKLISDLPNEFNSLGSIIPDNSDRVLAEDADNSYAKKYMTIGNIRAHVPQVHDLGGSKHSTTAKASLENKINDTGFSKFLSDLANEIHTLTSKPSPVGADEVVIEDSEDSWNKKRVPVSELTQEGDYLPIDGSLAMTGNLDMGTNSIVNGTIDEGTF